MPVKMKHVRAILDSEEPDYQAVAELGPEAIPHLKKLVKQTDPMLASKAAYAAGLIDDESSAEVLQDAAQSDIPEVRVAAAAAAGQAPDLASNELMEKLLADSDVGVRKTAVTSLGTSPSQAVRQQVAQMASSDSDPTIRAMCHSALGKISAPEAGSTAVPIEEDGGGGGMIEGSDSGEAGEGAVGFEEEGAGGGDVGSNVSGDEGMGGGDLGTAVSSAGTLESPAPEGFGGGSNLDPDQALGNDAQGFGGGSV